MIGLLLAIAQPAAPDSTLTLCEPVLARKAGGEIATIEIASVRSEHGGKTFEGRLTALQGMGPSTLGSASTHHLIRVDFTYRCRVRAGRVRAAAVNPLRP